MVAFLSAGLAVMGGLWISIQGGFSETFSRTNADPVFSRNFHTDYSSVVPFRYCSQQRQAGTTLRNIYGIVFSDRKPRCICRPQGRSSVGRSACNGPLSLG